MKAVGSTVAIKGALIAAVSFFTPMANEFGRAAEYHYFPDRVRILCAVFAGVVAAGMAMIAYVDSGFSRWRNGADNPDAQVQAKTDPPRPPQEQPKPQEAKCTT